MRLLNLLIFLVIMFMCVAHLAHGAETIYYTTNGSEPVMTLEEYTKQQNPPCYEWLRRYDKYSKVASDGKNCLRWRPWVCVPTQQEGVDVEQLPMDFCRGK